MGKDKRYLYFSVWVLSAIIGITYIFLSLYPSPTSESKSVQWRDAHLSLIEETHSELVPSNSSDIGLLLGGSNVLYGYSAKMLGNDLGLPFYNMSLLNEGFNFDAYLSFLTKAIQPEIRQEVKLVVYSTIGFYAHRWAQDNYGHHDEIGAIQRQYRDSLLPEKALLAKLLNLHEMKATQIDIENMHGDLDFTTVNCNIKEVDPTKDTVDPDFSHSALQIFPNRADRIKKMFPNAEVVFVVPSRHILMKRLETSDQIRIEHALSEKFVQLIVESPTNDLGKLCDAPHHQNELGRAERTERLSVLLKSHL
jgi:hypothetical protein